MNHSVSQNKHQNVVCRNKLSTTRESAIRAQYESIKREMLRTGTWCAEARFLDIGCSVGLYSEFWRSLGFRVTGIDLNAGLISEARARAKANKSHIHYEVGSADHLPMEGRSFDIVFANSILEHVPDWERCLAEWVRVLAPGGLLWIETTNVLCPRQAEFRWLPLYSWWPGFMKRIVVGLARGWMPSLAHYSPWPALHWFSFFQLRTCLEKYGLTVRDRFDCMDTARAGVLKRSAREVVISHDVGRWCGYLFVSPLVLLVAKPRKD